MHPFLAAFGLALVIAMSGTSFGAERSEAEFTNQLANALKRHLPKCAMNTRRALEIEVRCPDGRKGTIFGGNRYSTYRDDPGSLSEIAKDFARTFRDFGDANSIPPTVERSRIVPVIKDRLWLKEVSATSIPSGAPSTPFSESLNSDLIFLYAEDRRGGYRFLSEQDLGGLNRKSLRAQSIQNLRRMLPNIRTEEWGHGVHAVLAGGNYEASLLLLGDFWAAQQKKVDGDLVVAVPSRDVVIFTGSRNREGIAAMKVAAARVASADAYRITTRLFVFRNGRFVRY